MSESSRSLISIDKNQKSVPHPNNNKNQNLIRREIKDESLPCMHAIKISPLRDNRLDDLTIKFMKKHIPQCGYCRKVYEQSKRLSNILSKNVPEVQICASILEDINLELREVIKVTFKEKEILNEKRKEIKELVTKIKPNLLNNQFLKYILVSLGTAIIIKLFQ